MNPMKVLADQTADILRLFGDEITREEAAELLPKTPAMKVLRSRDAAGAGELAALVLAQFPRSEPPAERFVDYLPEFTADELAGIAADVEHPVVEVIS